MLTKILFNQHFWDQLFLGLIIFREKFLQKSFFRQNFFFYKKDHGTEIYSPNIFVLPKFEPKFFTILLIQNLFLPTLIGTNIF